MLKIIRLHGQQTDHQDCTSEEDAPAVKASRVGKKHGTKWRNFLLAMLSHAPFLCGYGSIPINTIFRGMNIHLPAILGFTRHQGFDPSPCYSDFLKCCLCKGVFQTGGLLPHLSMKWEIWGPKQDLTPSPTSEGVNIFESTYPLVN